MSEAPEFGRRGVRSRAGRAHTDGVSDEALLAAMAGGDSAAAGALVRRHQRRVFGIAFAITNDRSSAEDVAQEAFLRVWRHAAVFDAHRSSAVSWVSTIVRNLAIDVVRARRTTPVDPHDGVINGDVSSAGPSAEDRVVRSDLLSEVRRALSTLPAEQRRALLRAAFYGQTVPEISAAERIPLGTAKSRVRLALSKVRDALAGEKEALDGPVA